MPWAEWVVNVAYYSANGKIYVICGADVGGQASQTWKYDPVANTWNTTRAPIPVAMAAAPPVAAANTRIALEGFR